MRGKICCPDCGSTRKKSLDTASFHSEYTWFICLACKMYYIGGKRESA